MRTLFDFCHIINHNKIIIINIIKQKWIKMDRKNYRRSNRSKSSAIFHLSQKRPHSRMGRSARTVFTIVLSFRREVSHDAGNAGSRAHSRSDPLRDRLAVSRHIRAETEDGSQIQCQGQLRGINHRSTAAQGSSRGSR